MAQFRVIFPVPDGSRPTTPETKVSSGPRSPKGIVADLAPLDRNGGHIGGRKSRKIRDFSPVRSGEAMPTLPA